MRAPPPAVACVLPALFGAASAGPLDDYVSKPDPNFAWHDTGATIKRLPLGGTGYILNVTSQQWLDESRATGPNGAIWTHQLLVVVPKKVRSDKAFIYMTGGCNENPDTPSGTDEALAVEVIADTTGAVGAVLYQIPNCHIVYPSDPEKKRRSEDAMIAWAWKQYLDTSDPEWLPRLPMVKAGMAAMEAAQQWAAQQQISNITGWMVSGGSKRGWTTWMVGAVDCPTCPNIIGIAPLVPIAPAMIKSLHHMWRAYGGWTFAFDDYMDVNLTMYLDSPQFAAMMDIVDPINYIDRLARLPKSVVVSSDDEFMMMEWTRLWWDEMKGEKHLTIANNAEHSLASGIPELLKSLTNFASSLFSGKPAEGRPSFDSKLDLEKGTITVTIPADQPHDKVTLRHANTLNNKIARRDFRWVTANVNCTLPRLPVKGNCVQPIVWRGTPLNATAPGVYVASVPTPAHGWTGFYVEVSFPSDTGLVTDYKYTSPGMVWPQSYPYDDCHDEGCLGSLV